MFVNSQGNNKIFGDKVIKKQLKFVVESFQWETYTIANIKLPNLKSIFMLKESTALNTYLFNGNEDA